MMKWAHIAAMLLASMTSASPATSADVDRPQVLVETGTVAGTAEGDTLVFRGIPFAAPPVGALRWRAPAAPIAWRGIRDGSRYGAACPQAPDHKEAWAQVGPQSEDCLFLNVWRPKRAGTYPVMVFLHGGGFTYGAAGVPLYDGTHLSERGVVVVTLNYRLGRLGFFAHPALTAEDPSGLLGNYGIMDQVAALRWVRANIGRFGGDARNVTLFGESAGAGTVQILMASPVSTGLFHKAISESGAGGSALAPMHAAEALGQHWAESLGLRDATPAQLRAIPLAEVIKGRGFPFIDGRVVTASPGDAFRQHREMRIPFMIGSNSNEGSLIGNNGALARPILGDAYPDLLAAYARRPGSTPAAAAIDLVEDAASVLPSLGLADMHATNGAVAYGFYFTQVPVDQRAGSLGAPHGGEIEYLFGNRPAEHRWDAADEKVSKLTGDYWVRFARTGDPNGGDAPRWPAVNGRPTVYLSIGSDTHAAKLTPLKEKVQAISLATSTAQWDAAQKR